jgi:hypothetical protein
MARPSARHASRMPRNGTAEHETSNVLGFASDAQAFVLTLSKPTPVNERLRETIRHYREAIGPGTLG